MPSLAHLHSFIEQMGIERITGGNLDSWIGDIADLGNEFLLSIGSQLIMSTRDFYNCESQGLFSRNGYLQDEQVVITKPTPGKHQR